MQWSTFWQQHKQISKALRKTGWILVLFLLISLLNVSMLIPSTQATNDMFYSADGFLERWDTDYESCRNASSAKWLVSNYEELHMAQTMTGYPIPFEPHIYRVFLYFDTESIPDNAQIINANLTLSFLSTPSTHCNITVQNGQPSYPSVPLAKSDYNMTFYSGNGGQLDTTGKSTMTPYTFNFTEHSWITKTGKTKLCLRSSREIDGIAPTDESEFFMLVGGAHEGNNYDPKLTVQYRHQYVATLSTSQSKVALGTAVNISWSVATDNGESITNYLINLTRNGQLILSNANSTTYVTETFLLDTANHYEVTGFSEPIYDMNSLQSNIVSVEWSEIEEQYGGGQRVIPMPEQIVTNVKQELSVRGLWWLGGFISLIALGGIISSRKTKRISRKPRGSVKSKTPKVRGGSKARGRSPKGVSGGGGRIPSGKSGKRLRDRKGRFK